VRCWCQFSSCSEVSTRVDLLATIQPNRQAVVDFGAALAWYLQPKVTGFHVGSTSAGALHLPALHHHFGGAGRSRTDKASIKHGIFILHSISNVTQLPKDQQCIQHICCNRGCLLDLAGWPTSTAVAMSNVTVLVSAMSSYCKRNSRSYQTLPITSSSLRDSRLRHPIAQQCHHVHSDNSPPVTRSRFHACCQLHCSALKQAQAS
jgi:hypothetical protein